MGTTKMSLVELVQGMETRIERIDQELHGLRRVMAGLKEYLEDRKFADDIIAGVKAPADDAGDDDEQEDSTAVLRIEAARADNESMAESQSVVTVVSVGKRKETKREVLSPLEVACREIGSLATPERKFSAVIEGLGQVEQLLAKQDIRSLTGLMDGISELFSVHGRTLGRDTRRFLMERTRDIVYVLIQEYANLMEQGSYKEANTIRRAMHMTGVVRLEKMIEEKDLPPSVIAHMECLSISCVGQKKAMALLDALDDAEGEEDGQARGKLLVQKEEESNRALRRAERERKGKERAERDRVYRNEMRGSNAPPPKHGKR